MKTVQGVYLSESIDLKSYYSAAFEPFGDVVSLCTPSEIEDVDSVEFALCWEPADDAFEAFPALRLISSIAADVHNILRCSSLPETLEAE